MESVAHGMREIVDSHARANYLDGVRDGKGEERSRIKGILERGIEHEEDSVGAIFYEIEGLESKIENLRKSAIDRNRGIEVLKMYVARVEEEGGK